MKQIKESRILTFVLVLGVLGVIGAFSQAPVQHPASSPTPPQSHVKITGHLTGREPNFLDMLPPYPALDSISDKADVVTLRQWRQLDDSPRWELANTDVRMSYDRFAEALVWRSIRQAVHS